MYAYAAGVGLRRSTARTWGGISLASPLTPKKCDGLPQRAARERFRGKRRLSCGSGHKSSPLPPAARRSSNSPLCRLRCVLCFVLFGLLVEVDGLGARIEDAGGLEGRGAMNAKC